MTDLVVPTGEDLDTFSDQATDTFSSETKEQAIVQAMDLLWLATGVTEQPTDARIARIVGYGILDMAWALLIRTESKTEINSPFNSERIGSYSYQKARQNITRGLMSGVEWFDTAVALLLGDGDGTFFLETENVFARPYTEDAPMGSQWAQHDAGAGVWWS